MTAVAVVVVVVAAIVIVAQARSQASGRAHTRELAQRAEEARAALRRAEGRIAALADELTAARHPDPPSAAPSPPPDRLPDARAAPVLPPGPDLVSDPRPDLPASGTAIGPVAGVVSGAGDGATRIGAAGRAPAVLEALWALTALDRSRARRHAQAVSTAPAGSHAAGLAASLEDEVSRLREEAGTPGALRVALEREPAAGDSELLLRAVQALLGALSRHCQAYDLYVHQWEQRLLAVLVCEGFDGPDSVADDASEILATLTPVDGRLELDRDAQGRLRARLSIPAAH